MTNADPQQTSISELKNLLPGFWTLARFDAQVEASTEKNTKDGKPFREVTITDGLEKCVIRAWSDSPEFRHASDMPKGGLVVLTAEVQSGGNFGPEFRNWSWRELDADERSLFLAGSHEQVTKLAQDWEFLSKTIESLKDPRLARLGSLFLLEFGDRFRRSAAARSYHHARRGGLLEHTAQMMRAAAALSEVYTDVNRDLLLAGVLFHDCGKIWENQVGEQSFQISFTEVGELMGHISIGMEIVNLLWRKMKDAGEMEAWKGLVPSSEAVRTHLVHLVASHHGTHEFGSPVLPKTPEAFLLHHIDNMDAKMEAVRMGYLKSPKLTETIHERGRPLGVNLVTPLASVRLPEAAAAEAEADPF